MEESEKVFEVKRLKSRINALVDEEPDPDLLHIILAMLTDARQLRAAAE